ncbi:MAG: 16S rRNA (adenine(1518)-N(6)/adenine(1519)-N(6))-dimethyltransferase RsmA [Chloroflexi bacterium]|nr:16S rRNA (adenine(1518)-N(6)/adenine(1519)-N(6))-dimethyltransferase RsmA [Chloroflexota bacterium]
MDTKAWLRELELRPQKGLGQNFLVDAHVLHKIVTAAAVAADDTVLEVGPGLGTLTQALAERARRVVAVELDENLVSVLRLRLAQFSNTEIIAGDILALDVSQLLHEPAGDSVPPYKVVANIPYYITSAVLRHVLEASVRPRLIVLMVQREVAQRIVAKPGQMSLLAVSVQFYGRPQVVARVPARCFHPVPKVDSAIVRIEPHAQLPVSSAEIRTFFDVVRAGFGQRRKQLHNALQHGLALSVESVSQAMAAAGIDQQRRAQTLSVSEWVTLYRAFLSEEGKLGNSGPSPPMAREKGGQ